MYQWLSRLAIGCSLAGVFTLCAAHANSSSVSDVEARTIYGGSCKVIPTLTLVNCNENNQNCWLAPSGFQGVAGGSSKPTNPQQCVDMNDPSIVCANVVSTYIDCGN